MLEKLFHTYELWNLPSLFRDFLFILSCADVFGMVISESKEKGDRRRLEGGVHGEDLKSLQRAKGVYGGADMLRPRTKSKSGAHTLLLKPFAILSKTVVGFVMFLVFF